MVNAVTVNIPIGLREKAKFLGINISETSRNALADAVSRKEQEIANNYNKAVTAPNDG